MTMSTRAEGGQSSALRNAGASRNLGTVGDDDGLRMTSTRMAETRRMKEKKVRRPKGEDGEEAILP
ncbi:hypothetical protein DsansV1_C04g0043991 [Dioscorea sansibarensis]